MMPSSAERASHGMDLASRAGCAWLRAMIPRFLLLSTLATLPLHAAGEYPPFKSPGDAGTRGAAIQRTMGLLDATAIEKRTAVRVLFYGQSITEQVWWQGVKEDLAKRFPFARLEVENRAIGGHSSQLLVKTAEADLYPFQPDLVIFHVYGAHDKYEDIIRRIRERTTAEVLMATDHVGAKDPLDEPTDAAQLKPDQWNPWMNYSFLPATAKKYGCELLPVRDLWKSYLRENKLEPRALLKDDVHLNDHGNFLMTEIVKSVLLPLPVGPDERAKGMVREHALTAASWQEGRLAFEFEGNRVDAVFGGAVEGDAAGETGLTIDGKAPAEIRQLFTFTRTAGYSGTNWPCLLRVQRGPAQLQDEEWTVTLANASDDYKSFLFSLTGSKTGPDGVGSAGKKFVSKSGRIVIEPDDWNLQFCRKTFGRKLEEGFRITWRSIPQWNPKLAATGTLVQGLANGKHTLVLTGAAMQKAGLTALRVHRPPFPQTEDPAADASASR